MGNGYGLFVTAFIVGYRLAKGGQTASVFRYFRFLQQNVNARSLPRI